MIRSRLSAARMKLGRYIAHRSWLWVPPGHYYSPISAPEDIQRAIATPRAPTDVDVRDDEQVALFEKLNVAVPPEGRWVAGNDMYESADAAVFRAMLDHFRPGRLLEIGSGYSTAVALDVAEAVHETLKITCVEPYADRLRSLLRPQDAERLTLIEQPVQTLSPETLAGMVGPGDFFFIDSTHVVKPGSDVGWLLLRTLPLLPSGTIVHVHDIFWPFEYPRTWLEEGRNWTEAYLLHAFLINNATWRILFFNSYFWEQHPELIRSELGTDPGSIWLVRE